MTKKEILDKLEFFKNDAKVRFMFWKKNGTNAFDDNVQINSRFLDKQTGEMYDVGLNTSDKSYLAMNKTEPDVLIYLFSPEQAQDIFNSK